MASRKTQQMLAARSRKGLDAAVPAQHPLAQAIPPKPTAKVYGGKRDEHAEHLAMMEKLLGEVASLRATIAAGFDTLVAAVLDAAVEEASETSSPNVEVVRSPEPPAEDASKKPLAPAHKATLDDVRSALNEYTRVHGLAEASKVVQKLGVKRLTELPAERFAEAVEAFHGE